MNALLVAAALLRTLSAEPQLDPLFTVALQSAALELNAAVEVLPPGAPAALTVRADFTLRDAAGAVMSSVPMPGDDSALVAAASLLLAPLRGPGPPPPLMDPARFAHAHSLSEREAHQRWIDDPMLRKFSRRDLPPALRVKCRGGDAWACNRLCYETGERCAGDLARLTLACARGDSGPCRAANFASTDDRGRPIQPARALALAQRACELGDLSSCENSAGELMRGPPGMSNRVLERACEAGAVGACFSRGYDAPDSAHWEEQARQARARMCAADAFVCDEGCGGSSSPACLELLDRACTAANLQACAAQAELFTRGDEGLAIDLKRATQLFTRACDGRVGGACGGLGLLALNSSVARAISFFEKGCKYGDNRSCNELGDRYHAGSGVKKDRERARHFYLLGCEIGPMAECRIPREGR